MRRSFHLIALCLLPLLGACTDGAPAPRLDAPSFAASTPISFTIRDVQVREEYKSPLAPPNVEHFFPATPAESVKQWVAERIRTTGHERTLEVVIKDASVIEVPLPRTEGFKGIFTKDQALRYDASLVVELRMYGPESALAEASTEVRVTRSDTVGEDASPAAREQLFWRMNNELMQALNAELEKNIYQYFGPYLDYGMR